MRLSDGGPWPLTSVIVSMRALALRKEFEE